MKATSAARRTSVLLLGTNPIHTLLPALLLGTDVRRQTYEDLLAGRRFEFRNRALHVMFFFPYDFWNRYCEKEDDRRLYGVDRAVYSHFCRFWKRVDREIRAMYDGSDISYVIDPSMVFVDRDKIATHDLLAGHGVNVTEMVETRNIDVLLDMVSRERGLFIKSRYGAEGKGITRLRRGAWKTNYRVVAHRPKNHGVDDRWPFVDVTGDRLFLRRLIARDVIIEREVLSPALFAGRKFDVRAYVVGDQVVHIFLRHAKQSGVITNWSQGGIVEDAFRKFLSARQIESVRKQAILSMDAMKSGFGAVDFMFDRDEPNRAIVVEAQTMCSFPKPEECMLGERLIRFLVKKEASLKRPRRA